VQVKQVGDEERIVVAIFPRHALEDSVLRIGMKCAVAKAGNRAGSRDHGLTAKAIARGGARQQITSEAGEAVDD
jgi:hypothetical protein